MIALLIAFAATGINLGCAVLHIRMRRRAAATWRDAADAAQLAYLQARTIGQCRDLLCEDCCRIAAGHYIATAGPAFAEFEDRHPR